MMSKNIDDWLLPTMDIFLRPSADIWSAKMVNDGLPPTVDMSLLPYGALRTSNKVEFTTII